MKSSESNIVGRRELLMRCASALTGAVALGFVGLQGHGIILSFGQHFVSLAAIFFTRFHPKVQDEQETLSYIPCE